MKFGFAAKNTPSPAAMPERECLLSAMGLEPFPVKLLVVHAVHVLDQIQHLVGVAHLVVDAKILKITQKPA